jgi:hypothetical protein
MKTITKKQFKELIGESPEDMFGPDWKNYIEDYLENQIDVNGYDKGGHYNLKIIIERNNI